MSLQPPIDVHCGEETYQLSRLTQQLQDEFARWCEKDAWQVLQHTRASCDDATYQILAIEHQRMKRQQEFELIPGSEAWKYMDRPQGLYQFIRLAMKPYRAIKVEEVKAAYLAFPNEFKAALGEMFAQKKTIGTVPTAGGSSG